MATGQAYNGSITWDLSRERWILSVTDNARRSPVRIQPRDVFNADKLAAHLRFIQVPFTRIEFTDYTCQVFRAPVDGPSQMEMSRFILLLRTLYMTHKGRHVTWRLFSNATD